ncbi:hypothetical protein [Rhizobium wuzhouense]|uniref:Uncharacterized protein n=1 Tax=Rhizobium wuzhouense TaxID=1986026 RepID=A0ABX5NND8_9HYPH|nr:hypothetical protein [Rhizobium wuzhouense]PYB70435.1 hypothetical protein DMY87_21285 [Rhizobium wuzhouense]
MKRFPFVGLLSGFILWSVAFLSLYAVQATGCKLGWHQIPVGPISLLRLVLSGVLLLTLALLYVIDIRWLRPPVNAGKDERQMIMRISKVVHIAAAAATFVTFAGIFWLTLC